MVMTVEEKKAKRKIYNENNKEMLRLKATKYREENRDSLRLKATKYREENREKIIFSRISNKDSIIRSRNKYNENNKEKVATSKNNWKLRNKEFIKSSARDYGFTYRKNNKDKLNFRNATYRARKFGATIYMTKEDKAKIAELYTIADNATKLFGYDWAVDHIVPLNKGGLHKLSNLQVVPATWNSAKGDRNCDTYWD